VSEIVESFWMGALLEGGPVDLPAVADRAGGWSSLIAGGAMALIRGGVEPGRAGRWAAATAGESMGQVVTLLDPRYPPRLKTIECPPPVLLVQGAVSALSAASAVAIVGTRRCTAYGTGVAVHLAGELAARGTVVVSGLARGVDTHAHRAALRNGTTVAVLGHGLGRTSPASNRLLREDIVRSGGAIISTWPDGFGPARWTFPVRNRWIAALSDKVVVVEAPRRSGALITAREAVGLNRDVVAVPGPLGVESSRGCLELLASGAEVLTDVDEFVADVTGRVVVHRERWVQLMLFGAPLDEVATAAGWSTAELLTELSMMEVRGELVRLPGGRYGRGTISR